MDGWMVFEMYMYVCIYMYYIHPELRKHLLISALKGRLQVHGYISWNFIKAVESVDSMITYVYAQSMNERPLYACVLNGLMKDNYHTTVPFTHVKE